MIGDLNDVFYEDGTHDVLAVYINKLVAAVLRGEYSNIETLAADKVLTDADYRLQVLDPGGADREVELPAEGSGNHPFTFVNADPTYTITVVNDGANTILTLDSAFAQEAVSDGVSWYAEGGGGGGGSASLSYRIERTVDGSGNLTVTLKSTDGNDPSSSSPISVKIGGSEYLIESALSVTVNAGANTFNAGSAELATHEIDYFVYLGYNATDGVTLGISRIPFAIKYSDFNATATHEKYCAISTIANATSADAYSVIGRLNAVLSAGAGYTWTVPTDNVIVNSQIYHTRPLEWTPALSSSMTLANESFPDANYRIDGELCEFSARFEVDISGVAGREIKMTLPFQLLQTNGIAPAWLLFNEGGGSVGFGGAYHAPGTPDGIKCIKYNYSTWNLSTGVIVEPAGQYFI